MMRAFLNYWKRKVHGTMRVDTYAVLDECVENGINYGWRRAHKHVEDPDEDAIREAIHAGVMLMISERFRFDEEER